MQGPSHFDVAIIGAGFSGLGTAIRLKQRGFSDFVVLERGSDVGGTWRDNSYPGCACDVESNLYSFSFAPNPEWTRAYSPQAEIFRYLRRCAAKFGVVPNIRFHHAVRECTWQAAEQHWQVETSQGVFTARVLVSGTGALSEPSIPDIPGLSSFAGKAFHSAHWDHAHDLSGRSVAVIGTGASAIQFVPAIQPQVEKLRLFQRTPAWVVPRVEPPVSERQKKLFRALPLAQKLARLELHLKRELFMIGFKNPSVMRYVQRFAVRYLERTIADPVLRQKLTPSFVLGCKRVLVSNVYVPCLTQPNVEVISEPIREIRPHAVVTADGVEHPVDTIVFGTGFKVTDMASADHVRGRDGRTLKEHWQGSAKAHLGTTVAGFPNLFLMTGPNTGLGHSSIVLMIESQLNIVLAALEHMKKHGYATFEPRPEVQARFVAEVDQKMKRTVWSVGGCVSWYMDATGRNSTLWPESATSFRLRARFHPHEYKFESSARDPARPRSVQNGSAHASGLRAALATAASRLGARMLSRKNA